MGAITCLINTEVIEKGQQQGGNHAVGDKHKEVPKKVSTVSGGLYHCKWFGIASALIHGTAPNP
jgi:hypothetical protein